MTDENTQETLKAETVAGNDTKVEMAPEAKAAAEAEKAKEPTLQDKLNVLLKKKKENKSLSLKEEMQATRLAKQIKAQTRQRKAQRTMFEEYFLKPQKKQERKLMNEVRRMRDEIGRKDFQMLRDIFTVTVPEKKDEHGKVLEAETKQVNWYGLILEARNVIVVQREQRIKAGLRKRTTGRSSDRKSHKAAIGFLLKRNAEETLKAAQTTEG